jgi:hypothetical protein
VEQREDPDMNPLIYTHLIFDKGAKTYDGEKTAFSTNVAGKLDIFMQKTETRSISFTLYKYQLKVDQRLKIRSNFETIAGKNREYTAKHRHSQNTS